MKPLRGWRIACRLAAREGRRRPWAAAVAIAFVALPVAAAVWGTSVARAVTPTAETERRWTHGRAAVLYELPTASDVPRGLAADEAVVVRTAAMTLRVGKGPVVTTTARDLPLDHTLTSPMVRHRTGTTPDAGEVVVSSRLQSALGASIGDTIHRLDAPGSYTLVGVTDQADDFDALIAFVAPGSFGDRPDDPVRLHLAEAPTAEAAAQFGRGVAISDPDAGSAEESSVAIVFAAGLGLLVTALVLSAALAISAREQLRSLGLLGAAGATEHQLRGALTARSALIAAGAIVVGTPLGLLAALATTPALDGIARADVDGIVFSVRDIVAVAALALVFATAAGWIPAFATARTPTLAALAGRRPQKGSGGRAAAVGTVMFALGGAIVIWISTLEFGGDLPAFTLAGMALSLVGLALITPALVGVAARLASWGPGTLRLGLRAAARHRSRSGGVSAALVAVAAIAVGWMTGVFETNRQNLEAVAATSGLEPDQLAIANHDSTNGRLLRAIVAEELPTSITAELARPALVLSNDSTELGGLPLRVYVDVPRLVGRAVSIQGREVGLDTLVDSPGLLDALGAPDHAAARLAEADVVVFAGGGPERTITGQIGPPLRGTRHEIRVAMVVTDRASLAGKAVIRHESLAAIPEAQVGPRHLLVRSDRPIEDGTRTRLELASGPYDAVDSSYVAMRPELGSPEDGLWPIAAGAAVLVGLIMAAGLGLFEVDARQERAVLVAVGLGPRARRRMVLLHGLLLTTSALAVAIPTGYGMVLPIATGRKRPAFPAELVGALAIATIVATVAVVLVIAWRTGRRALLPSLLAGD